jgi:hypothetical protein
MVSYTDPTAPLLPSPVGLDAEIQRLQILLLNELYWLQISYGRAYRGSRQGANKKTVYFPEVYDGSSEYRDVLPNDNVTAQSFFYPAGPATNPDREPIPNTLTLTQACDLIVWANLVRVDDTKTYRFEHELLRDVLRVLNDDGQVRVLRAFTANEDIFRGFGLDAVPEQALRQPYCGFRIQMELHSTNILCEAQLVPPNAQRLSGGGYLLLRGQ